MSFIYCLLVRGRMLVLSSKFQVSRFQGFKFELVLIPMTHCSLFIVNCSLWNSYSVLFTSYLLPQYFLLFTSYLLLFPSYFLLFTFYVQHLPFNIRSFPNRSFRSSISVKFWSSKSRRVSWARYWFTSRYRLPPSSKLLFAKRTIDL